ncbi:hypothetical protein [Marinobacter nauticus]|uniref:hypothetical protein n=1 Tax=Marinobacter nauticus TaxID=2743 RepID=UPI0024322D61|nr:hypothetical protein [Marinobacter nauticus]
MRFIESREEFNLFRSLSESVIDPSKKLPENIFTRFYSLFLFFTFDEIHMKLFFRHLQDFLKQIGEFKFIYLVLDPSPEDYVCDKVRKYKAIEFTLDDSEDQFIVALNEYSGGDEPDCIMDNSDQILIVSGSKNWCIYADRDSDISICAFSSRNYYEEFQAVYGGDLLPSVEAAAKYAYDESADYDCFLKSYSID